MLKYKPRRQVKPKNPYISSIPMCFWDELVMAPKNEWPQIVKKYNLTPEQMGAAAERIKTVEQRLKITGIDAKTCVCNPYKFA